MDQPACPPPWWLAAAEIAVVGLPFCAFKLLAGLIALEGFAPAGYLLLALGAADAGLNTANLIALIARRRRVAAVCLAELLLSRRPQLALALDVLISFSLVAIVVGAGWLARLPAWGLAAWNVAVILNVVGAGVGRVVAAVRRETPTAT